MINVIALLKDGGYRKITITPKMFGELALAISQKGSEYVNLVSGNISVVGLLQYSKEAGDRIIVLNDLNT